MAFATLATWIIRHWFYRPLAAKNPQFMPFFWTLAFSDVDSWRQSDAQLQTSPIQRHQNHFCIPTSSWWNRAHKLWRSKAWRQKRDRKSVTEKAWRTDKKLNVVHRPGGGWNPIATKLYTVIEDLEHVLPPLKRLGVWRIVSPLWGTENVGVTRPRQIKTPITPHWANLTKL